MIMKTIEYYYNYDRRDNSKIKDPTILDQGIKIKTIEVNQSREEKLEQEGVKEKHDKYHNIKNSIYKYKYMLLY